MSRPPTITSDLALALALTDSPNPLVVPVARFPCGIHNSGHATAHAATQCQHRHAFALSLLARWSSDDQI